MSAATGAAAGGVTGLIVGPTKAEREERGKRRIEARTELGRSLRKFRFEYAQTRLQRLDSQPTTGEAVFKAGLSLATSAYSATRTLPLIERVRLRRQISLVVGAEMLGLASLQPEGTDTTSAAVLHMVAEKYRRDPHESINRLVELNPLDAIWDKMMKRLEILARRYP